jgi:hypothetical protein
MALRSDMYASVHDGWQWIESAWCKAGDDSPNARSLGIALQLHNATVPVDATPRDPHRDHFPQLNL